MGLLFTRVKKNKNIEASLGLNLVGGVVWGFIVAVGYFVIGINLLEIDISVVSYFNELMVLGISALGGIGWAKTIK